MGFRTLNCCTHGCFQLQHLVEPRNITHREKEGFREVEVTSTSGKHGLNKKEILRYKLI